MSSSILSVLLASERAYVDTLKRFRSSFVSPLELQDTEWKRVLFNKPEALLFTSLFDQILHLNSRFNDELQKAENLRDARRVFARFGPLFDMYCQYASVQQSAYAVVMKMLSKSNALKEYIESFEKRSQPPIRLLIRQHVENLIRDTKRKEANRRASDTGPPKVKPPPRPPKNTKPKKGDAPKIPPKIPSKKLKPVPSLPSTLPEDVLKRVPSMSQKGLRPLQVWMLYPTWRVKEYVQILEGILRTNTTEDRDNKDEDLRVQIRSISDTLSSCQIKISEALMESTHIKTLKDLEGEFAGSIDLIEAGRKFIMKATLQKQSRKQAISYVFHLFTDMLTYSAESNMGYKLHRAMALDECDVRPVSGNPNSFTLLSTKKSFDIICRDSNMRDRWFKALKRCIEESRENSHMERVTKYAAPWNPDETTMHCMLCKSKFTMLNRKHHCRSCGRVICGSCGKYKRVLQQIAEKPERICVTCNDDISVSESKMFRWRVEVKDAFFHDKDYDSKVFVKVALRQTYQHTRATKTVVVDSGKASFNDSFEFPAESVADSLLTFRIKSVSSLLSTHSDLAYCEIYGSTIARLKDGVAVTKLLKAETGTGKLEDPPIPTRDYQLMLRPPRKSGGESKITGMLTVRLMMVSPNASSDPSTFEDLIKESHAALERRPVAPLLLSYSLLLKTLLVNANQSKHKKIIKDILNRTKTLRNHSAASTIGDSGGAERHAGSSGGSTQALTSKSAMSLMSKLSPSQKVLYEIVTVSETFSGDLDTLIRVFVTPLERAAHGGKLVVSDQSGRRVTRRTSLTKSLMEGNKKVVRRGIMGSLMGGTARVARVLDQPDVKVLLSSIRQIATLNRQFTLDLKEKTKGWPAIIYTADTFEHFAAVCSRAFGTYARSHAEAVTHLESEVFSDFMRKVKEVTGADCRSLLGKPSVYVPRVRLQMQELIKQMKKKQPDHPDLPSLEKALGQVAAAGKEINTLVDKKENKLDLIKMAKRFNNMPNDLNILSKADRKVVKQGIMLKQCRRKEKPFYFVLLSDFLLYGDGDDDQGSSINFHRAMKLNETTVRDISEADAERLTKHKYAFEIVSKKKSFVVYLQSAAEKKGWLTQVETQVKANRKDGDDSVFAATWLHDSAVTACQQCSTEFTFLRRRHHCRACGEVVCDNCSKSRNVLTHIHASKKQRVCDKCNNDPERYKKKGTAVTEHHGSAKVVEADDSEDDSEDEEK